MVDAGLTTPGRGHDRGAVASRAGTSERPAAWPPWATKESPLSSRASDDKANRRVWEGGRPKWARARPRRSVPSSRSPQHYHDQRTHHTRRREGLARRGSPAGQLAPAQISRRSRGTGDDRSFRARRLGADAAICVRRGSSAGTRRQVEDVMTNTIGTGPAMGESRVLGSQPAHHPRRPPSESRAPESDCVEPVGEPIMGRADRIRVGGEPPTRRATVPRGNRTTVQTVAPLLGPGQSADAATSVIIDKPWNAPRSRT